MDYLLAQKNMLQIVRNKVPMNMIRKWSATRDAEIHLGASKTSAPNFQGRPSPRQIPTAPEKNVKHQDAVRLTSRAAQMPWEIVCALNLMALLKRETLQHRLNATSNAITRLDVGQIISVCSSVGRGVHRTLSRLLLLCSRFAAEAKCHGNRLG